MKLLEGIKEYISCGSPSLEKIITYYRQNLPKLSLLCGENGDPGFSVKLKERIVPEVMRFLKIPEDDKEIYYFLDFIINGMLSFLTAWYSREGEMPALDTISGIRDALMNGCRETLMNCSSDLGLVEHFVKIDGEGDQAFADPRADIDVHSL